MVFDGTMRFVLVRGSAIQQAGLSAADLEGRLASESLPGGRWPFYQPLYEAALRGESSERLVKSPDGSREYMVRVSPVRKQDGSVIGGVSIASDITREVAEEVALAESEQRYRLLVDNSADVIFQQVEGKLEWISPAVESLLGWTAEELTGHTTVDLWHPDDLQRAIAVRNAAYGGRHASDVLRIRHKDGHYLAAEFSLRPAPEHGHAGMVGTFRDVSARVAAEEALHSAEERYRLVAENVSDVVTLVGEDDRFTWVSPSCSTVFGWDAAEIIGHLGVEFVHPDDLAKMRAVLPHARAGERRTEEYRVLRGDGTYTWVSVRSAPILGADGLPNGRVAALRDVDDSVHARFALEASQARLSAILNSLPDPHVVLDPVRDDTGKVVDFQYAEANPAACAFNMLNHDQMIGMCLSTLHPNVEASGLFETYVGILQGGSPLVLNDWAYRQDLLGGEERRYDVRAVRVGDSISQVWRDVTERYRDAQAVADAEERYRMLAENTMDLVIAVDNARKITWVSSSVSDRLGYQSEELIGADVMQQLIHLDDRATLREAAGQARLGVSAICRIRLKDKSGAEHWVEAAPRALHNDEGELVGEVIGVRDIHEVVQAERALAHEVDFDALTGLAKRALGLKWIDEVLRTRRSPGWALLCVGVDGMTAINQGYTYAAGDQALKAVAERLVEAAGARDRVARVAGDEFVVLLRDIESPTDAANAAERLASAVAGPLAIGDTRIQISACVGIALAEHVTAEELVRDASMAMRQASARGRGRWEFLDASTGKQTRAELAMQLALQEALDSGEIQPWLMPIADIRTAQVVGYEALVRWVQADGAVVTPDRFLDLAERTGQILAVDRAMLTGVLNTMQHIPDPLHIAVNVSAATLATGALEDWVRSDLLRTSVDPKRLHLEVTETALLKISTAITATMQSLAGLGISWWVDDFGTGFSSISHLRDLPVSGLKLDQSFTMGVLLQDSRAAQLSHGLAGLATALGLRSIAEGVETPEQAAVLAEQGWQLGQGWLFGKAAPLVQ